jgi:hypothetical protein
LDRRIGFGFLALDRQIEVFGDVFDLITGGVGSDVPAVATDGKRERQKQ